MLCFQTSHLFSDCQGENCKRLSLVKSVFGTKQSHLKWHIAKSCWHCDHSFIFLYNIFLFNTVESLHPLYWLNADFFFFSCILFKYLALFYGGKSLTINSPLVYLWIILLIRLFIYGNFPCSLSGDSYKIQGWRGAVMARRGARGGGALEPSLIWPYMLHCAATTIIKTALLNTDSSWCAHLHRLLRQLRIDLWASESQQHWCDP